MDQTFPSLQTLEFRRQFLIGPKAFKPTSQWKCIQLDHGLLLSAHPDLLLSVISDHNSRIVLIGNVVDPLNPKRSHSDIAESLIIDSNDIWAVAENSYPLAGRWVTVYQNKEGTFLFSDPCGFRQVFYTSINDEMWCGSQPEIIKAFIPLALRNDDDLYQFLRSRNHVINESVWLGEQTIYEKCRLLMPNHYLDVNQGKPFRFYPKKPLPSMDVPEIVRSSAFILQGIIEGVTAQNEVLQALTAGLDSRILLAASKMYSNQIEYFVDRQGVLSNQHRDVWVPKALARKLKIKFSVKNSNFDPPGWFVSLLSKNVTNARVLPKTRPIYTDFTNGETRLHINGNGSEICRNWYDQYCLDEKNKIDVNRLPGIHGFIDHPYVKKIVDTWKENVYILGGRDRNILDLLYWELRLGVWGAQHPAEEDLATEEFSPFNCRLLIDILLSAPRNLRSAPKYQLHRMLIEAMWPETLSLPINPFAKRPGIPQWKRKLRSIIPSSILRFIGK